MRQQIDRTFGGKKPGRVGQREIDDHVVEAHGPDSAPKRISDPPGGSLIEDPKTPNEETPPFFIDDEVTTIGNREEPPPVSTRLGDYLPPTLFS